MSTKMTAILGIIGVTALGAWLKNKRRRAEPATLNNAIAPAEAELDDDEAAEIIRRARPALERAAQLN